ncbi:MAG TPA: hypothetical protein PKC14_03955 [Candidatus Absconditabacterales bacterium]|nr:hypothetical protein [Candidatus Absconditabacterales bacterium]
MLYQLSILKKKENQQYNANILLAIDSEEAVREIFSEMKIIILSLTQFNGKPETFGNNSIAVDYNGKTFQIIHNDTDLKSSLGLIQTLGFSILSAQVFDNSLSADQINQWVEETKLQVEKENQMILQAQEALQAEEKNKYTDEHIEKVQALTETTLKDIQDLVEKTTGNVGTANLRKIKTLEEELKKTKLGNNVDKMSILLEELFGVMEEIELEYLEVMKTNETKVMKNSLVSTLDVVSEYDKYKKAQKVTQAGVAKTYEDAYYAILGKGAIYQKFLQKDFLAKFQEIPAILSKLYDYVDYFLVFVLIEWGLLLMVRQDILQQPITPSRYIYLIQLGAAGIVISLAKPLRTQKIIILLLLFPIAFIIRYRLQDFIISNFL